MSDDGGLDEGVTDMSVLQIILMGNRTRHVHQLLYYTR